MTEKRELIDTLMDRTGLDPYKLKRLSSDELKQLHAAYKEDEETIVELLEKLEPENYLSGREQVDREMANQVINLWNRLIKFSSPKGKLSWIIFFSLMLLILFIFTLFGSVITDLVNGVRLEENRAYWMIGALTAVAVPIVIIYAYTLILGDGLDNLKLKEPRQMRKGQLNFLFVTLFILLLFVFAAIIYFAPN